jgi:hypothetical protein
MPCALDYGADLAAFIESPTIVLTRLGEFGLLSSKAGWSIVEHSRYSVPSLITTSVREEFALFCASRASSGHEIASYTEYLLDLWQLKSLADLPYTELSGGYKKLVLLAIQCEGFATENVILANVQHQLDEQKVKLLLANVLRKKIHSVMLCDESVSMLEAKLGRVLPKMYLADWLLRHPRISQGGRNA